MDCYDQITRSRTMRSVLSKNTTPELVVRSFLFRHGFRFRLHSIKLPGHPDIVLPKYKTVVDVRGCFWHHHSGCRQATLPSSNTVYWQRKFSRNVERDKKIEMQLKELGWHLIIVWECELKKAGFLETLPGKIKDYKSKWQSPKSMKDSRPNTPSQKGK